MTIMAVSGVHGTGKTTLVNEIHRRYNSSLVRESATHCLQTRFPFKEVDSNLALFQEFQLELLEDQIQNLLLAMTKGSGTLLADRTPIDSLGYVVERLSKERSYDRAYYELYRDRVYKAMRELVWDKIFFLDFDSSDPVHDWVWKRKDCGDRNPNPFYLDSLNAVIFQEYMRFSVLNPGNIRNIFKVEVSSLEGRMEFFEEKYKGERLND